jgi:undecaprenyl-diphosphatase
VLKSLDLAILYFFNRDLANPVFDIFFTTLAESRFIWGLLIVIIIVLAIKGGSRGWQAALLAIICFAITDPSAHYILKKIFCRLRPCHIPDDLRLITGCGGLYGFPSNHAANSFALAYVFSFFYRRLTAVFFSVATLVCISRVYLGKHYLSDVVAGAVFGVLVAILIIYFMRKPVQHLLKIKSFNIKGSTRGELGDG